MDFAQYEDGELHLVPIFLVTLLSRVYVKYVCILREHCVKDMGKGRERLKDTEGMWKYDLCR